MSVAIVEPVAGRRGFGTKAQTLASLQPVLGSARIPEQFVVTRARWRGDPEGVVAELESRDWASGALAVRSSALDEDGLTGSMAGHYVSVLGVRGHASVLEAMNAVAESMSRETDEILVQPMIESVSMAGVAFTRDPNSRAPYDVVNYDVASGSTTGVTAGGSNDLEVYYRAKSWTGPVPPRLAPIVTLLRELESHFGHDALDVEFCVDDRGTLYLLQVRPLVLEGSETACVAADEDGHDELLTDVHRKIASLAVRHPDLCGDRLVLGVMPDWNPAEMIGIRPRSLARSLYQELITDTTWAYQRDNYGYRNLRSFPLMIDLCGLPYIDVRLSFNSFVPGSLPRAIAERLVNHYIEKLVGRPSLHDKVEFEIVHSCYGFELPEQLESLAENGFPREDIAVLRHELLTLSNSIINRRDGLWQRDLARISTLEKRRRRLANAGMGRIETVYWLIEDCKRYGTLPFAGLARTGFIAVQLLTSLRNVGVLSDEDCSYFMASLDTVGSRMAREFRSHAREDFLASYGHLRPGTYDIFVAAIRRRSRAVLRLVRDP